MRKFLLVILFVVSVFAANVQRPYVLPSSGKIPSAVMMPNCEGFYTYKYGKVTRWKLNPIQPVESFIIQKNNKRSSPSLKENIFITKDGKRLIFKSRNMLQLWDLKTKKLVKEIKAKYTFWLATYSHYGLVLLDYKSKLQLLDDKTFEVLKQTDIPRSKDYGEVADNRYYPMNMIVGKNILHVNYYIESYYVDLKTLSILDSSETSLENRMWISKEKNKNRKSINRDLKNNITTQLRMNPNRNKYFQKYKSKFNSPIWKAFMKYPWATHFYSTLSSCQINPSSYITLYKLSDYFFYTLAFTKTSLNNVTKTYRYKVWQDGDSWYVEDENHFFNASEDIKQYLYYINDSGVHEEIDTEMFNRYKKNYKKTLKIKE